MLNVNLPLMFRKSVWGVALWQVWNMKQLKRIPFNAYPDASRMYNGPINCRPEEALLTSAMLLPFSVKLHLFLHIYDPIICLFVPWCYQLCVLLHNFTSPQENKVRGYWESPYVYVCLFVGCLTFILPRGNVFKDKAGEILLPHGLNFDFRMIPSPINLWVS